MNYQAVVKGGLHAEYSGQLNSILPFNLDDRMLRRAAQALDNKGGYGTRKIIEVLLGAPPGNMATYAYPEIAASPELGGARPVNITYLVNRPTTTNDLNDLRHTLTSFSVNTTEDSPINGDRNPLGTR